jgi:L-iditol 2-dehydrogenase
MRNRIAELVSIGSVKLREEETQPLHDGEVLVKIRAAGLCGSDRHYFLHGGLGSFKQKLPMPMGHEAAGEVIESRSAKFQSGDRVALEPARQCDACTDCLKGKYNLCTRGTFMGANAQGAFSDYVTAHEKQLMKMPDAMSFEAGALLEPLGVVLHALNLHPVTANDTATIFGCGPIGLSMLYLLRKKGVKQVFMIDRIPYRTAFAKEFGATEVFMLEEPWKEMIKEKTEGRGTSLNIDAAGEESSINGCMETSSTAGHIMLIGIPETDTVPFNPHRMRVNELTLQNVRRSNQTLRDCISLTTGDDTLARMITHRLPLESLQKGLELTGNYQDGVIKCMILA